MPELPEVEVTIRQLQESGVIDEQIVAVRVESVSTVALPKVGEFQQQIQGRRFIALRRRGKYIVAELDEGWTLLLHLRMSGRLLLEGRHEGVPYARVIFQLASGRSLQFYDPRKFGRIWLTRTPEVQLAGLGVEPLDAGFSSRVLGALLHRAARPLKAVLLDQHVVAGIGNIYCDEALWDSGLHPLRHGCSLCDAEVVQLHRAIRKVLRKGIRNLGTSLGHGKSNFKLPRGSSGANREQLMVYGRDGDHCFRCGGRIEKIRVAQRGTHYCPVCQPELTAQNAGWC